MLSRLRRYILPQDIRTAFSYGNYGKSDLCNSRRRNVWESEEILFSICFSSPPGISPKRLRRDGTSLATRY